MNRDATSLEALWQAETVYRADLFAGRAALVSGGGSGIGCATALLLARLGAQVMICGRSAGKLEAVADFARARGACVETLPTDIRDAGQVEHLFAETWLRFGRLDHLINAAGGQYPQAAMDFTRKGWDAVIDVNLNGTWQMMQRGAQLWRGHGSPGTIVNVVVVTDRGLPGIAHTVAARSGVIGLTRTVAVEWAPLGIRVNCVAPGVTQTQGMDVYEPEVVRSFQRANPMRRMGRAMEIAEACIYLSADSAAFVSGEVLTVDGGGRLWGELWCAGRPTHFD